MRMKQVYSGTGSMTPNEKHEFSNNLVRSIAGITNDTETNSGPRQMSVREH